MELLVFLIIMVLSLIVVSTLLLGKPPQTTGSFTVTCYKKGEIVYKKTYENENFTVGPGKEWDRCVIEG